MKKTIKLLCLLLVVAVFVLTAFGCDNNGGSEATLSQSAHDFSVSVSAGGSHGESAKTSDGEDQSLSNSSEASHQDSQSATDSASGDNSQSATDSESASQSTDDQDPSEGSARVSFDVGETDPYLAENGGSVKPFYSTFEKVTTDYGTYYQNTKGSVFTTTVFSSAECTVNFIVCVTCNTNTRTIAQSFSGVVLNGETVVRNEGSFAGKGWSVKSAVEVCVAVLNLKNGANVISFTMGEQNLNIVAEVFETAPSVEITLYAAPDEPDPKPDDPSTVGEEIDLPAVDFDLLTNPDSLNITWLSFNLRQAGGSTGGDSNKAWSVRGPHLIQYVLQKNADVMCFQEVDKTQYSDLEVGLDGYTVVWYARQTGSDPEGLAVAFKTDKFALISQERYWLSETPEEMSKGWGEKYYRIVVTLQLEDKTKGIRFNVSTVHIGLSTEAQIGEANLMISKIAESPYPSLLAGDFNMTPLKDESGNYVYPAYGIFTESLNDLRIKFPNADDFTFSAYADEPSSTIDFFMATKDSVSASSYKVLYDKWMVDDVGNVSFAVGYPHPLSDHYAILCSVNVQRTLVPEVGSVE